MQLMETAEFAPIFEPHRGTVVGLVDGYGNVGDTLLYQATRQLLRAHGVEWRLINPLTDDHTRYDISTLLLFAGGSMGGFPPNTALRHAALRTRLQCIVLPQSFLAPEPGDYARVYVRERESLQHCPRATIAPDLALAYNFPVVPPPTLGEQIFLRHTGRSVFGGVRWMYPDPAEACTTPEEYISLASKYEHIITDRLHFAITALGLGRRVTLLPVGYHKNKGVYSLWLEPLGCSWRDTL